MRRPPQRVILPVTEPSHAVFLSYASQDAEAAQKICEALRAAGIEVFLDQSELRGGDAWDQKIRREIHDCALFIPVISANTASRHEGYFRLEWDLADQRTHMIARSRVFVVPVCLDATTRDGALMFQSRFSGCSGRACPAGSHPPPSSSVYSGCCRRSSHRADRDRASRSRVGRTDDQKSRPGLLALEACAACNDCRCSSSHSVTSRQTDSCYRSVARRFGSPPAPAAERSSHRLQPAAALDRGAAVREPERGQGAGVLLRRAHRGAAQLAGRDQRAAGRRPHLGVLVQGNDTDIGTIAHKLNVGAVLEGSVRRSAHTIRITAQLINAVTGFHLWSKTYDRDLGDVLKLQTEIATAVASALKVTLLGDVAAKIELGGTRNPAAFDAYLRGAKAFSSRHDAKDLPDRDCRVHGGDPPGSALCARVRRPIDRPRRLRRGGRDRSGDA